MPHVSPVLRLEESIGNILQTPVPVAQSLPTSHYPSLTTNQPSYNNKILTQPTGLTFIGTDPLHERRGAASLLLQWGLRHCKQDNVPAYLESTVDAGPLYERHGFARAETISMALQGRDDGSESVLYEEVCFIFRPGATTAPAIEHDLKPMH